MPETNFAKPGQPGEQDAAVRGGYWPIYRCDREGCSAIAEEGLPVEVTVVVGEVGWQDRRRFCSGDHAREWLEELRIHIPPRALHA